MVIASSAPSFLTLFSSPRQHIFSKEEPNGFEDLCRGFAVFNYRATAERSVCCSRSGDIVSDYYRYVHRPVPRVWIRGDVLGCRSAGGNHCSERYRVGWPHVDRERSASPGATYWRWGRWPWWPWWW